MGFCQTQHFFWINLTKCSAPGGINLLILILIWSTFWERSRHEISSFWVNVNVFLGKHLSRLSKTQTFRMNNLSTFLSLTAMSWPEPNEKADRSTRVQVQGQDGLSCQLVNAENCSLVRTCTREYTHHCPRHTIILVIVTCRRRQRQGHHQFCETAGKNKLLLAQTGGQTCGLVTEIYSSIDAILKRRDWPMNEIHV